MNVAEKFDSNILRQIYFSENRAVGEIIIRNTAGSESSRWSECTRARHRSDFHAEQGRKRYKYLMWFWPCIVV